MGSPIRKEENMRSLAIPLLLTLLLPRFAIGFQSTSVFRSNTRLVQVNVIVRDKHGPVTNLSRNDFTLTDSGRLQDIKLFSMNSAALALANQQANALASGTFSNGAHNGVAASSVTIVLVDALNTLLAGHEPYEETPTWVEDHALANAKQQLAKFLAHMQPHDLVAIYSLGHGLHVLSDFTSDRQKLMAVLNNYSDASLTRREDAEPLAVHTPVPGDFNKEEDRQRRSFAAIVNVNRSDETMRALLAIARHVSGIPGRKNLVWLTANLPFSETAAAMALGRAGVAIYPVDARGLLTRMPAQTEDDLFSQITRRSLVADGQGLEPTGISQMRTLAEETNSRGA
jgi:VWFA-related protein